MRRLSRALLHPLWIAGVVAYGIGCGGGDGTPGTGPGVEPGDSGSDACDPTKQACGECKQDTDCPAGAICEAASHKCAPGCTTAHGCQAGKDCCDGACVDLQADGKHCGACTTSCAGAAHGTGACKAGKCSIACDKGFEDCNGNASDGCETGTSDDPKHCGGCSNVCSNLNISTLSCAAGKCTGSCNAGFDDCDGDKLKNGCETAVDSDPKNCGGCGNTCSGKHVVGGACTKGKCTGSCEQGWGDCNGSKETDGCETHLDADPSNCGSCSIACSSNHVPTPACTAGVCSGACASGWSDCDGNLLTNGCELQTEADPNNCGGCGLKCSSNHLASVACSAGTCNGACAAGYNDCNGNKQTDGCESQTQADPFNCGACGNVCSTLHVAASCQAGLCNGACEWGWSDCDGNKQSNGCETATGSDPSNCGACGMVCSSSHVAAACVANVCAGACEAGWSDCNGNKQSDGCEVLVASDVWNCGSCGHVCSSNHVAPACASGVCSGTCDSGWVNCDGNLGSNGCEVFPATDPVNCGSCGVLCSANHVTQVCSSGACAGTCYAGYANCDGNLQSNGCETSIGTDPSNCGSCGLACSSNHIFANCSAGLCNGACVTGFADCNGNKQVDGCETDIYTDPNTCGGCGTVCSSNHIGVSCWTGSCNGTCAAGWADCNSNKQSDGCETDILTDPTDCGACGKVCSANHVTPSCGNGVCDGACTAPWQDCDGNKQTNGCEINLQSDTQHCGTCTTVCSTNHVTALCTNGVCAGTCSAGWQDCDGNKQANGCEINTATDVNNCGTCGNACGSGQKCISGACQTCNTSVLVLGDANATPNQALVTALNASGLTATLVSGGLTTYSNSPAAANYGAIIIPVGSSWGTDMPLSGQTAIVNANNAGTTGVVFTAWGDYNATTTIWATLKQLVIWHYTGSVGAGTRTYNLTSAGHPVWTGLPNSFVTVSMSHSTGYVQNGGVSIASMVTPAQPAVVVKDGTGRIVEFTHAAHSGLTGGAPWSTDTNLSTLMANAAKWVAKCY